MISGFQINNGKAIEDLHDLTEAEVRFLALCLLVDGPVGDEYAKEYSSLRSRGIVEENR